MVITINGQDIEARVIQKIATEAEWAESTILPRKGEFMIVGDSNSTPINIKVGNGVDMFPALPYMFDSIQQNVNYYPINTLALPTPAGGNVFSIVVEGDYTFGGSPAFTVPVGSLGVIYWDGSVWSLQQSITLPVVPISNEVIEGGSEATSQDAVYQFVNPVIQSFDIDYSAYVKIGTGFDSAGNETPSGTSAIISNLPIDISQGFVYYENAYVDSLTKYFFRDINGDVVGGVRGLNTVDKEIPIVAGAVTYSMNLYRLSAGIPPDFYLGYKPSSELLVSKIVNADIVAKYLSTDNEVPTPVLDNNGVNLGYLKANAVLNSDIEQIEVESTINHLDLSYLVEGRYINSDGSIGTGAGNKIIEGQPITEFAGQQIIFSGIDPNSLKKLLFRDIDGTVINGSVISLTAMPLVATVPPNAVTYDVSLKRATETDSAFEEAMFNSGTTVLPYEPHRYNLISKIKGVELYAKNAGSGGGGTIYDQSLNTTDDVKFNTIETGVLSMVSWVIDLPEGAGTPPIDVEIGDAWVDTTDGSIKRRMV